MQSAKTAQNSIHFAVNRKKCSVFNGYSYFGFQTKILFCLILYAKAAIVPYDYPVVYAFTAADTGALCGCCVPCACACAALDDDVSFPPRKHAGGHARAPPGGAGVGRGGWHGVAHAWDSYIYLIFYTFIHIANSSN